MIREPTKRGPRGGRGGLLRIIINLGVKPKRGGSPAQEKKTRDGDRGKKLEGGVRPVADV